MPFAPRPREIYRIDLTGPVVDREWNATHRVCVVLEVHSEAKALTVIFGSWNHYGPKCHCVDPGTDEASPFGDWMTKKTHFSALNVAIVPIDRIIERIGDTMVSRDEFDAYDEVAVYAELQGLRKRTN